MCKGEKSQGEVPCCGYCTKSSERLVYDYLVVYQAAQHRQNLAEGLAAQETARVAPGREGERAIAVPVGEEKAGNGHESGVSQNSTRYR